MFLEHIGTDQDPLVAWRQETLRVATALVSCVNESFLKESIGSFGSCPMQIGEGDSARASYEARSDDADVSENDIARSDQSDMAGSDELERNRAGSDESGSSGK